MEGRGERKAHAESKKNRRTTKARCRRQGSLLRKSSTPTTKVSLKQAAMEWPRTA